jgi:hypothetical protein
LIVLLGEVLAKPVEAALPDRLPLGNLLLGRSQHRRLDAACAHPPGLFGPDEPARLQDLEVLDHHRQRHGERLGELEKAWFEANRVPMRLLVETLNAKLGSIAPEIVGDPKR